MKTKKNKKNLEIGQLWRGLATGEIGSTDAVNTYHMFDFKVHFDSFLNIFVLIHRWVSYIASMRTIFIKSVAF